jgi:hypothetical protein
MPPPRYCSGAYALLRAAEFRRVAQIALNRVPRRYRGGQRPLQRDNRSQGTVLGQYQCPAPGIAECSLFGCCPDLIQVCLQVSDWLSPVCSPLKNQAGTGSVGRQLPQVTHTDAHPAGSDLVWVGGRAYM